MNRVSSVCFVLLVGTFLFSPVPPKASSYVGEPDYWPTDAWQTSTPKEQGMDNTTLQEMDEYIDNSTWAQRVDSLLIIRNGYIVYERYRTETRKYFPHHIFSCTKVITSSLLGICLQEGYINSLDDPVVDYFPDLTFQNMDAMKENNLTIRSLLTMSSGLEWVDQEDYYNMMDAENPVEYVLSKPIVTDPGVRWNYNSGGSHVLSYIINNVSGVGTATLAKNRIFDPLGITDYHWNVDSLGTPNGATLLYLTSRDMAKIGFLYLNNGTWNGTQILSEEWVTQATQSQIEFESNDPYFEGYGWKWWIPQWTNSFAARGSNTQNIVVLRDENAIIVSTGGDDFPFEIFISSYIIPSFSSSPSSPWLPWTIGGTVLLLSAVAGGSIVILKKRKKLFPGQ